MDLAELLADAERRGYTSNLACHDGGLHCAASGEVFGPGDAWIVDSVTVDQGTDPGDDATVYLVETGSGTRGYLIVSDSFHADPDTARFVDALERRP